MISGEERLVEAFVDEAQHGLSTMTDEQLHAGWQRLQSQNLGGAEPDRGRERARLRLGWVFAFALGGVVVGLAAYRLAPSMPAPLHYTVQGSNAGATTGPSAAITGASELPTRVLFSDQSHIELEPMARMSVDALDAHGARVTLLDGAIDVSVRPRARTAWTFVAGPFQVHVKGTAFHLAYVAEARRMSLRMRTGLVEVSGARGRSVEVSAGQSLDLVAEPEASTTTESTPPTKATTTPQAAEGPREPTEMPVGTGKGPDLPARTLEGHRLRAPLRAKDERPVTVQPTPSSWARLITDGRFADVIADAEKRGIDTVVATSSAPELSSLADAARYTKRPGLARQVLLAMRSRFADSEAARDASFFLGRLGEATAGQPDAALAWYETYLREAPRGLYASEALGREMTLLAPRARARAKGLAKQYLERFPHGSQAELARSLLETGED